MHPINGWKTLRNFWSDQTGQGLSEYALLVAAVVALVAAVSLLFREDVVGLVNDVGDYIGSESPVK